MKKLIFVLWLFVVQGFAQSGTPVYGNVTGQKQNYTAAQLAALTTNIPLGTEAYVIDASTSSTCTTGGGTNKVSCIWNGISWVVDGGGGGGTTLTTKGDIQGFSTVAARVPVGADNTCFIADSTQTLGVKWSACSGAGGTVTSVAQSFTGGLISVSGSPVTGTGTLALTVAGTSGGVPYFSSASTWASSALLTNNAAMFGGGAGLAPKVDTSITTNGSGLLTVASLTATGGTAGISIAAATAPSGVASSGLLFFDTATSRLSMNNNNVGTVKIMSLSDTLLAAQMPILAGDVTSAGATLTTVVGKVNGIAYSATAAAHSVEVVTTANTTATAKVIPDCQDSAGNHLNFTQSSDGWSCGTTSSGGGASDWMNNQIIMQWLPDQGGGWTGQSFGATDINGVTANNTAPTSTTGFSNLYITTGSINNSQGFSQSGQTWYAGATRGLTAYTRGALTISAVEVLAGLWFTDQTALTMLPAVGTGADNPAGNYVGIYLCNTASTQCNANGSKTNFFCIMKNGTTQTVTDSTIAADTSPHSFQITEDGSNNWGFKIDGSTVCGAMSMTNKPAAGSLFRIVYGIDPLAAVAKRLGIEGVEGKATK